MSFNVAGQPQVVVCFLCYRDDVVARLPPVTLMPGEGGVAVAAHASGDPLAMLTAEDKTALRAILQGSYPNAANQETRDTINGFLRRLQ